MIGVHGLARIGPNAKEAVADLCTALNDTDQYVRCEAAWALGKIGPAAYSAVPELRKALWDQDRAVRVRAVESLGQIGPAARDAIPDLRRLKIEEDDCPLRTLQRSAAEALSRIEQ